MQWVDSMLVFVVTESSSLYRSTDGGISWNAEASKLPPNSKVYDIVLSKQRNFIYLVAEPYSVSSRNSGITYDSSSYSLSNIVVHPLKDALAAASHFAAGCYQQNMQECWQEMLVTVNGGASWDVVDTYVNSIGWATSLTDSDESANLIATDQANKSGGQYTQSKQNLRFLYSSSNHFESPKVSLQPAEDFISLGDRVFVGESKRLGHVNMYVSTNGGQSFQTPQFNGKDPYLLNFFYEIIASTENDSLVLAVHEDHVDTYPWGNLYVSDADAAIFELSLDHIVLHLQTHAAGIVAVEGLPTVLFANIYDVDPENPMEVDGKIQTLWTSDRGITWRPVTMVDHQNVQHRLQFHPSHKLPSGDSYWGEKDFGPLFSRSQAAGLLMGTGNVGDYLDSNNVNVYLSRDAGESWEEVVEGDWTYDWATYGNIFVMAPTVTSPDLAIRYSVDGAASWSACSLASPLPESPVAFFDSVRVASIGSEERVLLTAVLTSGQGALFHLDFSQLYSGACSDDDLEWWSPTFCENGRLKAYLRRKLGRTCWSDKEEEERISESACPCKQDDYECDIGWVDLHQDGFCVNVSGSSGEAPETCQPGESYPVSQGYRLIEGNGCDVVEGLDLNPIDRPCPRSPSGESAQSTGSVSASSEAPPFTSNGSSIDSPEFFKILLIVGGLVLFGCVGIIVFVLGLSVMALTQRQGSWMATRDALRQTVRALMETIRPGVGGRELRRVNGDIYQAVDNATGESAHHPDILDCSEEEAPLSPASGPSASERLFDPFGPDEVEEL